MDPLTIATLALGAVGAGTGVAVGYRLSHAVIKTKQQNRHSQSTPNERRHKSVRQARVPGRQTSIVGLSQDMLRHADGGFSRGYRMALQHTILGDNERNDAWYDQIARVLAMSKPKGTVIQFRYNVAPDSGQAIQAHIKNQAPDSQTHRPARQLHDPGIRQIESDVRQGRYRLDSLDILVRLPGQHSDRTVYKFAQSLQQGIQQKGLGNFSQVVTTAYEDAFDVTVRRAARTENDAALKARRFFHQLELMMGSSVTRLTQAQLWEAVYRGHRLTAKSAPTITLKPGLDISHYLCQESIEYFDGFAVVGGTIPVSIVSLLVPPQPFVTADVTRALVANARLAFPHTLVTEYIAQDQHDARKKLDKRIRQVKRTMTGPDGRPRENHEASASREALDGVRADMARGMSLLQARMYAIVYGQPAATRRELSQSVRALRDNCEELITAIRSIPGADAGLEDYGALQALFPKAIYGEADAQPMGREILEVNTSLVALTPTESAWPGARAPHTLVPTTSGRLIGLDLFDLSVSGAPLAAIIAMSGAGKSVLLARLITDVLATKAFATVEAVDYGRSLAPLVQLLGGRHILFDMGNPRPVNIWAYVGLESGEDPDEAQIAFVVADLLRLAGAQDDPQAALLLQSVVKTVYANAVPRNLIPGQPPFEPTHSHAVNQLRIQQWNSDSQQEKAADLAMALELYCGNPWLDAPTHPDFLVDSPLNVYELDTLQFLPKMTRDSLAFRITVRVARSVGRTKTGILVPNLIVFDEVRMLREQYPAILSVIEQCATMGRRSNVVTLLATQGYEDIESLPMIRNNIGSWLLGRQSNKFDALIKDTGLSENAAKAIRDIHNVPGIHSQFVTLSRNGELSVIEPIQIELSPAELWAFTSHAIEKNARAKVQALKPDWVMADIVSWLARNYPRGLVSAGLQDIDAGVLSHLTPQ